MEGSGFDQRYQLSGAARPYEARRRSPGLGRLLAAALLAAIGAGAMAAAAAGLTMTVSRAQGLVREAGPTAQTQRFAFDRRVWQALVVDDLFPPVYRSATAAPALNEERDFTRIGVAPPADCRLSFDPGMVRLLAPYPCGPVLRADYTDASRTLVATVGVAFLGTSPVDQEYVNGVTTQTPRDDQRPHAVAFPGTPAAGFADPQRLAFRVFADAGAPFLTFAVVGFSDGRLASVDTGPDALKQSGAQLAANDLEDMLDKRLAQTTGTLWARSQRQ